jgi:hypothetical protein
VVKLLVILHTLGIAVATIFAAGDIETIIPSGLILGPTGILIALASFRAGCPVGFHYGLAAPTVAVICFCIIFGLKWGPSDAENPITTALVVFSLISLPLSGWGLKESYRQSARNPLRFQFSIASLLWAMLIVALVCGFLRMGNQLGTAVVILVAYGMIIQSSIRRFWRVHTTSRQDARADKAVLRDRGLPCE